MDYNIIIYYLFQPEVDDQHPEGSVKLDLRCGRLTFKNGDDDYIKFMTGKDDEQVLK